MAEYISREAAIDKHCAICKDNALCYRSRESCPEVKAFNSMPAADVAPVHHAKDIYYKGDGHCEFKCSLCGVEIGVIEGGELDGGYFRYCPGCGAKMDAKEEQE